MSDAPPDPPPALPGIELAPGVTIIPAGLRLQYARSGGPGGQNVNKINSKAELWMSVALLAGITDAAMNRLRAMAGKRLTQNDELHLAAETSRSQEQNRAIVFQRLREMILSAMREPKRRRKTRPSRASKQRRLESKRKRSEIKSRRRGIEGT